MRGEGEKKRERATLVFKAFRVTSKRFSPYSNCYLHGTQLTWALLESIGKQGKSDESSFNISWKTGWRLDFNCPFHDVWSLWLLASSLAATRLQLYLKLMILNWDLIWGKSVSKGVPWSRGQRKVNGSCGVWTACLPCSRSKCMRLFSLQPTFLPLGKYKKRPLSWLETESNRARTFRQW